MKKTSLADIATALGVSKTLVSLVLNNRGDQSGISKATQQKVWDKASELKYIPNAFARGLRMGKSNTIGMIVADISNSFYARICRSAEDAAEKAGYQLIICSSDEKEERETALIRTLRDRQVDGLIIATTQLNDEQIAGLKEDDFPFVLFDRQLQSMDTDYVVVDNEQGAFDAVNHLVDAGHKRIGMFTISPGYLSTIADRAAGYERSIAANELHLDPSLICEIQFDSIYADVKRNLQQLCTLENPINALFVVNNHLATAVLEAAAELNISIPDQLALVSFDDIDTFRFCHPPVTAIAQPLAQIGKDVVKVLVARMEKEQPSETTQQIMLPTQLVVRKSCGSHRVNA